MSRDGLPVRCGVWAGRRPVRLLVGRPEPPSGHDGVPRRTAGASRRQADRRAFRRNACPTQPVSLIDSQLNERRATMIAERLWAMMGRSPVSHPGADQLLAGLARLGIATPQLETLGAMLATPDLAEKLAHQTASATQALHEARALAAEAQRDRVAAEAAWREADRIEAELEAASAAHAARSAELDSRAHVIETREREIEKTLHDLAALKAKYESKLAAIEAIVKDPVSSS